MTTATAEEKRVDQVEVPDKPVYKTIELSLLRESENNPRKSFDDEALKELAASVKEKGVLEPLIVRPIAGTDRFEIVAGARRYRASKIAGLKEVGCLVHQYTDAQAIEVMIIENLQRQDVSAIDEAFGYRELLKRGYSVEQLAAKIKKGVRYVYGRLELQKLADPVRKAVEKGEITATHAQIIGRLDREEDQVLALGKSFVQGWDDEPGDLLVKPEHHNEDKKGLITTRDLEKTVAAMAMGAEILAQKETLEAAGQKVFIVSEKPYNAHRSITSRNRWKSQGAKLCKFPSKGILVDGAKRGKVVDICANTNCTKHFKTHSMMGGSSQKRTNAAAAANKPPSIADKLKEVRAQVEREVAASFRSSVFQDFLNAQSASDRSDLEEIAVRLASEFDDYEDENGVMVKVFPFMGKDYKTIEKAVRQLKDKELSRLLRGLHWASDALSGFVGNRKKFLQRAKELKVDLAGHEKSAKAEIEKRVSAEKAKLESGLSWSEGARGDLVATLKSPKVTYVIKKEGKTWGWSTKSMDAGSAGLATLEEAKSGAENNAKGRTKK